jgi:Transposase
MGERSFRWFAAVDWGSEKHQVCVLDAEGGVMGEREFRHSGAGLTQLADWVQSITGPASTVAIAIEVPHGPVVDVLLDRGFCVYSINPKQLDRLRDRFSVAGAKDDRRDARAAQTVSGTTVICFAAFRLRTRIFSSYANGHAWPRNCNRNEFGSATASITSSGGITRRCSSSLMTWRRVGCWSFGARHRHPIRRNICGSRP